MTQGVMQTYNESNVNNGSSNIADVQVTQIMLTDRLFCRYIETLRLTVASVQQSLDIYLCEKDVLLQGDHLTLSWTICSFSRHILVTVSIC
jgi:hypothetical protein